MKAKDKYPDLVPQLRQERFQIAIIEELTQINDKLDKLVSLKEPVIESKPEAPKKTTTRKTTRKVATKEDEVR